MTANFTLSYEHHFPVGLFDASTTVAYSSAVTHDLTGVIRQASYGTANAQAGLRLNDSGVRVGAFVRNLTNKENIVGGLTSAAGFIADYAPPREVGLSLNYAF